MYSVRVLDNDPDLGSSADEFELWIDYIIPEVTEWLLNNVGDEGVNWTEDTILGGRDIVNRQFIDFSFTNKSDAVWFIMAWIQ